MSFRRLAVPLKILLPVAILAVALGVTAALRATKPQVAARPVEERVWPVSVVTVKLGDDRPAVSLNGEIVAGREVELRPLVAGRIVAVAPGFREGGTLAAGEEAMRIDPFAYEAGVREREAELLEARARLAEIEAELAAERGQLQNDRQQAELARNDLKRREDLKRSGAGTQKAVDDARLALNEREARLLVREQSIARFAARRDQTRAAVARAETALERARRSLEETVLPAPFDGFLYDTAAAIGKQVGTSDRLARLIDARSLEARFHAPDNVYARLLEGGDLGELPTRVLWTVGGRTIAFPAALDRVESRITAASGGVDLFARLPDLAADTPLRAGAFVSVEVKGRPLANVARLPRAALHDGNTVYAVRDGRLQRRTVEPVGEDGTDVLVRGELADGDLVVGTRFPEMAPGIRVAAR